MVESLAEQRVALVRRRHLDAGVRGVVCGGARVQEELSRHTNGWTFISMDSRVNMNDNDDIGCKNDGNNKNNDDN